MVQFSLVLFELVALLFELVYGAILSRDLWRRRRLSHCRASAGRSEIWIAYVSDNDNQETNVRSKDLKTKTVKTVKTL